MVSSAWRSMVALVCALSLALTLTVLLLASTSGGPTTAAEQQEPAQVVYSTLEDGVSRILRTDVEGGSSTEVRSSTTSTFPEVELSPDGRHLAYLEMAAGAEQATAHVIDLEAPTTTHDVPVVPTTGASGLLWRSVTSLTFSQISDVAGDVYGWDLGSPQATLLAASSQYVLQPDWPCSVGPTRLSASDWSSDGRRLLLTASADCFEVIFADAVLLEGGVLSEVFDVGDQTSDPTWVDGGRAVVAETSEGIWVADFGGEPQLVASDGTAAATREADREIAYVTSEVSASGAPSAQVEVVEDETAPPEQVPDGAGHAAHVEWIPLDERLLVVSDTADGVSLTISQPSGAVPLAQANHIFDATAAGGSR